MRLTLSSGNKEGMQMSEKRSKEDRVLSIRDLNIAFETSAGTVHAIRGIRMDL